MPESIYAANATGELLVGKNGIYGAGTYQKVETLSLDAATEIFFDLNGKLYYFVNGAIRPVRESPGIKRTFTGLCM